MNHAKTDPTRCFLAVLAILSLVLRLPADYGTWESALEESLNRAINLRILADESFRARQLERLEAEGFLLIRPLDRALASLDDLELPQYKWSDFHPELLKQVEMLE